jgi:cytochrome c oxidase subunit 2
VSYVWFTPTRAGQFDLLCLELCGIGHYTMRGRVIVEEEPAFRSWLGGHPTFAQTRARKAGDTTAGERLYAVCAACHGTQGEGNPELNAPKLAGQPGWYLKRQLGNFRSGARGSHEKDVYGRQMAPMAATLPDEAAINDVLAYIGTLPDRPAPRTVSPQTRRGGRLYATCAACHGADGRGIEAMNAPRLAGMSDWYLVTQLRNFKQGIRGTHPKDPHGPQMGSLAATLVDDRAIYDVVAHINGL